MLKNIIITLVSLIVTAYLVLFSDLSTAFIDKTTAYNIDLVFKSNFPKLRTHELILGFSSDDSNDKITFHSYQKIHYFTQQNNTVSFTFNTRQKEISALQLEFTHLNDDFPKSVQLDKVIINGQAQIIQNVFNGNTSKKVLENTDLTAVDINPDDHSYALNMDISGDNKEYNNRSTIVFNEPFYVDKSLFHIDFSSINMGRMICFAIGFILAITLLQILIIKFIKNKSLTVYFNIHDFVIIFTLYIFNALIVLFFVRDFSDALEINLTCLLVSMLEFTGFYALLLLLANRKIMFIALTGVLMTVIVGQLMCLVNSLSYISLVSAGNINLDNLYVLFNEYNYKFPALFILAMALFISSQSKPKRALVLKNFYAKGFVAISVVFLTMSFLLNTLPNGTRVENFQSPILGWVKTNIIRLYPESINYISPVATSYLSEYPENNFNNKQAFYNDSVYEKDLPYPLIKPLNKPNVIVFFVESFTSEFIDTYRENPLHLMPYMSNLQVSHPDKGITLVRNYFNHSATTIKNIRSQLLSGFQYDSVVHKKHIDDNSLTMLLGNQGYETYFIYPENKNTSFYDLVHITGFNHSLYSQKNDINSEVYTNINCSSGMCQDDQMISRLKDLIHYHKRKHAGDGKPFFISTYNIGTHLNEKGRLSFNGSNNIILNRNYTLDFDLSILIQFYFSELSEDTIMILTADHAIIPGDYDSEIIDFDQDFIVNEVPFYIFQPYYQMPKEIDVHDIGGNMNSLAMAPTLLHLLRINSDNYFLGCSFFEKECRRAVNLSKYAWYTDDGIYFAEGTYENNKKFKPTEINNKLQLEYPDEDFRIYNQYRKGYINIFDK